MVIPTVGTPELWMGFAVLVVSLLALDLGVFHRRAHVVSFKEATAWSLVWIAVSIVFGVAVYLWLGPQRGLEFLTGYLIEKALSVDNLFVFVVIFSVFSVDRAYQHRVLFWGVVGALVTRAAFIVAGSALLHAFHWAIYILGGFLVVTGIRLFRRSEATIDAEHSRVLKLFRSVIPSVSEQRGQNFFVRIDRRWYATPLLAVLIFIETTDVVFALDSIPAVFAVTSDPFIVFTSNIFAILGLRALYFVIAGILERLRYLRAGLSVVLVFVGMKMLVVNFYKVPVTASLGVIAFILGVAGVASLWPRDSQLGLSTRDKAVSRTA